MWSAFVSIKYASREMIRFFFEHLLGTAKLFGQAFKL